MVAEVSIVLPVTGQVLITKDMREPSKVTDMYKVLIGIVVTWV